MKTCYNCGARTELITTLTMPHNPKKVVNICHSCNRSAKQKELVIAKHYCVWKGLKLHDFEQDVSMIEAKYKNLNSSKNTYPTLQAVFGKEPVVGIDWGHSEDTTIHATWNDGQLELLEEAGKRGGKAGKSVKEMLESIYNSYELTIPSEKELDRKFSPLFGEHFNCRCTIPEGEKSNSEKTELPDSVKQNIEIETTQLDRIEQQLSDITAHLAKERENEYVLSMDEIKGIANDDKSKAILDDLKFYLKWVEKQSESGTSFPEYKSKTFSLIATTIGEIITKHKG